MAESAKNFDTDEQKQSADEVRADKNVEVNTNRRLHKIEGGGEGNGIPQGRLSSLKSGPKNSTAGNSAKSSSSGGTIYDRRANPNSLHSVPGENIKEPGKSGASDSKGLDLNKPLSPEEVNAAESSPSGSSNADRKTHRKGLRVVPGDKTEETEEPGAPASKSHKVVKPEAETTSSAADRVGKGFSMTAVAGGEVALARQAFRIAAKLVGQHKKGFMIGGVLSGAIIAIVLIGFAFVVSHELLTIEADLVRAETEIEQHVEKTVDKDLLKNMVCRAMPTKCKSSGPADEADSGNPEDTSPLATDMDKFSFKDPLVSKALGDQGINVGADANGNLTLTDANTGDAITADGVLNDSELADRFQTALPEWDVDQIVGFLKQMESHAGATFAGVSDTDQGNTDEEISNDDTEGDTGDNALATDAVPQGENNQPTTGTDAADQAGTLKGAITTADKAIAEGESATEATDAGVASLEGSLASTVGETAFVAGTATMACTVEKEVNVAAKDRIPTIITLLIRHGATLLSLADQLKSGHITGNEVNSTMQLLNGNPNTNVNVADKGTANDDSLPFSASATWQMAIGNSSASTSPGLLASAMPTVNSGQLIVNSLDNILVETGLSKLCGGLTSSYGIVIQFALGVGQVALDIGSFGLAQIAISSINISTIVALQTIVLPQIIQYFTPIGLSGRENSVQTANNSGAGLALGSSDFMRSLGGEPLSPQAAGNLSMEATQENQLTEASLPLSQRLFSFNNPDSLVSNLALDMPTSLSQTFMKLGSYFTQLPRSLMRAIGSIFSGHIAFALADTENPSTLYNITQYGFDDSELDQFDPIQNETHLYQNVTIPVQKCTIVKKKTVCTTIQDTANRMAALGDPNNYSFQTNYGGSTGNSVEVNSAGTPVNNDLLHCFVDGYVALQENISGQDSDNYCGGMGSYDATDTTPGTDTAADPYANLPNDSVVAQIYCDHLQPIPDPPNCSSQIAPQAATDTLRFRQYLLDINVMNSYMELTN